MKLKEETPLTVIPAKTGPKSKYDPSMCDKIVDVARNGGHVSAMMVAIDVRSKETFYRWQEEYPEFKEAYNYAKVVSQDFHENVQLMGALGKIKDFNATTFAMIMNNKFSDEYKRGTGGGSSTEITINQLTIPAEQVTARIAQKLEQLRLLGVDVDNPEA